LPREGDPIPVEAPADYDPKRFEVLARQLASLQKSGKPIKPADFHKGPQRLLKISPLPRGKTDVNNAGAVSMDFVNGGSEKYAAATWPSANKLWRSHEDYQRGMLYFLRTDERVAGRRRAEVAKWGLRATSSKTPTAGRSSFTSASAAGSSGNT